MLGQDLSGILREKAFVPIETDLHNLDITDITQVKTVLQGEKPDFIVHAAAYTNVDGAEAERDKAFLINEKGTQNIARISGDMGIPIAYISTDYVFDGTKDSPYVPDDPVNPINAYGESKLAGEKALKGNNPNFYILRTSWLYGRNGKNFVDTMISLSSKMPELRVVNDQTGCPTWTVELSRAIALILTDNRPFGTYHVCGSGATSWFGFAKRIMELMDIDIPVIPVSTEEFPRPARRPQNSVMDNAGICPHWGESLAEYVNSKNLSLRRP